MARTKDPARLKAVLGDPVVTLARTRVPLDQPLPPEYVEIEDRTPENPGSHPWKDFVTVLENTPGCREVGCSRVAEDPEAVLFVISMPLVSPLLFLLSCADNFPQAWWDQEAFDEFKGSPDYAVFLVALGMLDLAKPGGDGVSPPSSTAPPRTIQTVKFLGRSSSYWNHLSKWISLYTVTLAHPVTDEQRELYLKLSGPRYPKFEMGSDECIKRIQHSPATVPQGLHHGWVQELRHMGREGEDKVTVIQDAVFYKEWLSKEAEEAYRTAIPGVKMDWDDELCKIGAIEAKEEHVGLFRIGLGLQRRPERAPLPPA
jgi:hypothetical protein